MHDAPAQRRTALVTGASGGIGKGIAQAAAREGWHLVLTARTTAGIEAYADDWRRRHGIEIVALAQDLSLPGGAQALFEQVQARGLRIDALVNNAGIGVFGEFAETDLDAELGMLRLNIEAPTVLAKRFLPGLLERGGRILNIASVAAFPPGPYLAAYYGSKAYLRAWSEGIAEELERRGVAVTVFCPGPVRTRFAERAQARRSALFRGAHLPDGDTVGRAAWQACMQGRQLVVHGVAGKLLVFLMRFTPRRLIARIVRHASRPA